jgi:hypothetical protein
MRNVGVECSACRRAEISGRWVTGGRRWHHADVPRRPSASPPPVLPDEQAIDALYGLEPVFEPGAGAGEPTQLVTVRCPYCGESIDTVIDLSAGSFRYIEDCQVCCAPIDLAGEVDDDGTLVGLTAERA